MAVRLLAAIAALGAGAVALVVAAEVLRKTPGPVSVSGNAPAAVAPARRAPGWPAPPAGAIVFSREDGARVLALAALPGEAQVSVVSGQGHGVTGLAVSVSGVRATACGPGCYRVALTPSRPAAVDVRVGSANWHVAVPWSAPNGATLMARASAVWRALESLTFSDRLASDATHAVETEWRIVAPDRVAYDVRGGDQAVIIGTRRWDRSPGGRWVESPSVRLRQPLPLWVSVTDAHVVAQTSTSSEVTFYDPGTPAWFDVTIEKRTLHTLVAHMRTTAHFMFEHYGGFDGGISIRPPG
ncbi:MAG: hypothetical protein JOY72_02285 [Actinobacteria bacterium]|nr:hypothetical protein [Actinomycetota bacterium]